MKKATALIRLGKTLYLRFGNFLRQILIDRVRPDPNGAIEKEEGYDEHEDDVEQDRFNKKETFVVEMADDLKLADHNNTMKKQIDSLLENELKMN